MSLFSKFGEFDSYKELNKAAEDLVKAGEEKKLIELALENGIDREDAEDYVDGLVPELCNELMAALGKLKVESEELKPEEIMYDWVNYIRSQCADDSIVAAAVRKKGKSLRGCITELLKWSFKNQKPVDGDILKAAGVKHKCSLGIPGMARAKQIIMDYYLK